MADYTFGVPWRPGDEWRQRSWGYVRRHLEATGRPVRTADDDPEAPFSRAASANLLAAQTGDVFILHDADMVCPLDAYQAMADLASESGRLVIGYTHYRALDQPGTVDVIEGRKGPFEASIAGFTEAWSRGGVAAITTEAWRTVGGMDPRFRAWGCEDWAFAHICSVILGPFLRVPTPAAHLWHPHASTELPDLVEANSRLLAAYTAATDIESVNRVREVRV